jgi:hypothetical protein
MVSNKEIIIVFFKKKQCHKGALKCYYNIFNSSLLLNILRLRIGFKINETVINFFDGFYEEICKL